MVRSPADGFLTDSVHGRRLREGWVHSVAPKSLMRTCAWSTHSRVASALQPHPLLPQWAETVATPRTREFRTAHRWLAMRWLLDTLLELETLAVERSRQGGWDRVP